MAGVGHPFAPVTGPALHGSRAKTTRLMPGSRRTGRKRSAPRYPQAGVEHGLTLLHLALARDPATGAARATGRAARSTTHVDDEPVAADQVDQVGALVAPLVTQGDVVAAPHLHADGTATAAATGSEHAERLARHLLVVLDVFPHVGGHHQVDDSRGNGSGVASPRTTSGLGGAALGSGHGEY